MSSSLSTQLFEYTLKMIRKSEFKDINLINQVFFSTPHTRYSLTQKIRNSAEDFAQSNNVINAQLGYRVLLDAVSNYLLSYPAPVSVKQKRHQLLFAWCESMADQYSIPNCEQYLCDLSIPVEQDLTIGIIKDLHAREGISKASLAAKYQVTGRTIQTTLHRLSGENKKNPLRIAGFSVQNHVSHHEKTRRSDDYLYYTPNTMSPVFLQLNITQTATLLQSFYYNYDKGNNLPLDMAIDTWCQLSEYTKERIREVFCSQDPDFSSFLDLVEAESDSWKYCFMTESEMLNTRDIDPATQLILAFKSGMICDLELRHPHRTKKRQRIYYDFTRQCYYSISADTAGEDALYFETDDLLSISESV